MEINKKLKIFIASSSAFVEFNANGSINIEKSNNGKLKPIIEAINQCGFDATPWYENEKFLYKGDTLLSNLIKASKTFDGGIFVLGKDIKKETTDKNVYIPNSNVLLEMGMFLSSRGISRVFMVIDNEVNIEIERPSDLQGYIYTDFITTDFSKEFRNFFSKSFLPSLFDKITFYHGESLTNCLIKNEYKGIKGWKSKGLYIGTESARIWDSIESHDTYNRNISFLEKFVEDCNSCNVDFRDLDNIVSFGSGNGKTDRLLVTEIKKKNDCICYVPIDINPYMAYIAMNEISSIPTRVPFVIIDDFEKNIDHIGNIIENKTHIIGQNNLFSLLGVTFSNLENTEDNIFLKIRNWMGTGDYLLLDALIQNGENTVINELTSLLLSDDFSKPQYKKLIINSIKKKYREDGFFDLTYDDINNISNRAFEYIQISEMETQKLGNYTNVENTRVLDCYLKYNNKKHTLLVAKRYDYKRLLKKIKQYFIVVHSDKNRVTNRGLFLLKVKP